MPTAFQALERVPNACQILPNVVTGGQPSTADLEAFRGAGGGIVLDLRDPMEPRPLDESATTQRLGLEYIVVPVTAGTTRRTRSGRPCGSGCAAPTCWSGDSTTHGEGRWAPASKDRRPPEQSGGLRSREPTVTQRRRPPPDDETPPPPS